MARVVKGSRKSFCRDIGSKMNARENTGLLLDGGGNLLTNRKDEVLNVIFSFVFFIYKICPKEHQPLIPVGQSGARSLSLAKGRLS